MLSCEQAIISKKGCQIYEIAGDQLKLTNLFVALAPSKVHHIRSPSHCESAVQTVT
jgi:hypothetical protein